MPSTLCLLLGAKTKTPVVGADDSPAPEMCPRACSGSSSVACLAASGLGARRWPSAALSTALQRRSGASGL